MAIEEFAGVGCVLSAQTTAASIRVEPINGRPTRLLFNGTPNFMCINCYALAALREDREKTLFYEKLVPVLVYQS